MLIRVKVVKGGVLLDGESVRSKTLFGLAVFSSVIIGIAAALAIQWILIGISSFKSTIKLADTMFILAISVVAGYGAREILPAIARRIENEIIREEVQKEVQETTKEMTTKVKEQLEETDLVTRALATLNPETPHYALHQMRNEMESYLKSNPTARKVTIILARICRADNDLGKAIAVLYSFLKARNLSTTKIKHISTLSLRRWV
jgi:hypothetical protein